MATTGATVGGGGCGGFSAAAQATEKALLLGRYRVGRLLGSGNFSKVYHAVNESTGEEVAIKVIDKEKVMKSGLSGLIKNEVSVLRRVRHPNIVQLHEVMATRSRIYFVMEYVSGGELFQRVSRGRLPENTARKYFQQLISAMAFCHARGVFHRDIKPENLLVDQHGDLKVADFGLSTVAEQMRQDGKFHTLCGTPAYTAPEVLARRGYDAAKADVWSCGVVLFALMAGYLPFKDDSYVGLCRKVYKGEFRCPRWFSPSLIRLLRQMIHTNAQKRISIRDIMENDWFKKDFKEVTFFVEDGNVYSFDDLDLPKSPPSDPDSDSSGEALPSVRKGSLRTSASLPSLVDYNNSQSEQPRLQRPRSLNAFDIISFSHMLNLSGLFEDGADGTRFISSFSVPRIIGKVEEIGETAGLRTRTKDCQVTIESTGSGGREGPLRIVVEVFELTMDLVLVEVKKKGGDKTEYDEFSTKHLKPGLAGFVYSSALTEDDAENYSD